jgi:hypothetical protein
MTQSNELVLHESVDKIYKDLKNNTNAEFDLSYDDYVSMGKELLKKVDCFQARIAFYALKVCDIRHGGISKNIYTCRDYAISLGIPVHTLSEWTLIYRNVILRLDIKLEEIDSNVWKNARRTNDRMGWDNPIAKVSGGNSTKRKKHKINTPLVELKRFFKEESSQDGPSFPSEFRGYIAATQTMVSRFKKRDLNLIDDIQMITLMKSLDEASDILNDFLTAKKKSIKKDQRS